ncbi:MDR/zinc-dependent alcohol dehydrogenase-like family protein [Paraburkholderia sediminicola]|uniref:hypothetical protein n=1 Tax=Paraburkholderia sediminicola TaxID=458836 RepID=UPI0038BC5181
MVHESIARERWCNTALNARSGITLLSWCIGYGDTFAHRLTTGFCWLTDVRRHSREPQTEEVLLVGNEKTVCTRSPAKAEAVRNQGAGQVVISSNEAEMQAAQEHFDVLLDIIPLKHHLNPYRQTLKFARIHMLVGLIEPVNPSVHSANPVMKGRSLAGSLIGDAAETQEMLDLSAKHVITCDIEIIDIGDNNKAFERVVAEDMKYRFVIDMESLEDRGVQD